VTTGGESSPESSDGNEAHPFSDVVWIKAFNIGLRRELVPEAAFAFSCNDADGALYFLVPRSSGSAIGTMYSEGEVGLEEMSVSSDEVAEVLRSVGRSFPELKLSFSDVRDIEVGLLPARMNKKSNKYELLENDQIATAVNFVDVIAVKFTTFLRLGRQVVASLYGKQDTDLVAP
jgi:glycerol-3-phosphate dehydrogenase